MLVLKSGSVCACLTTPDLRRSSASPEPGGHRLPGVRHPAWRADTERPSRPQRWQSKSRKPASDLLIWEETRSELFRRHLFTNAVFGQFFVGADLSWGAGNRNGTFRDGSNHLAHTRRKVPFPKHYCRSSPTVPRRSAIRSMWCVKTTNGSTSAASSLCSNTPRATTALFGCLRLN